MTDSPFNDLALTVQRVEALGSTATADELGGVYDAASALIDSLLPLEFHLLDELVVAIANMRRSDESERAAERAAQKDWGVRFHAGDDPVEFDSEAEARAWLRYQGCPPPLMRRDEHGRWQYVDGAPLWGFLEASGHVMEFADDVAARRWWEVGGMPGVVVHREAEKEPWLQVGEPTRGYLASSTETV